MQPITLRALAAKVLELASSGPDQRNPTDIRGSCFNFNPDGTPSCIFGCAVVALGYVPNEFSPCTAYGFGDFGVLTREAIEWGAQLQDVMDNRIYSAGLLSNPLPWSAAKSLCHEALSSVAMESPT